MSKPAMRMKARPMPKHQVMKALGGGVDSRVKIVHNGVSGPKLLTRKIIRVPG